MIDCQRCTAPSQLYLCSPCTAELRDQLRSLLTTSRPGGKRTIGWLEALADAAVSQTVMGRPARHIRSEPVHLDGDASLASCIEPYPDEDTDDLEAARYERQQAALRHALAAGKVNARAARLRNEARVTLTTWTRHLAEQRGITWQPLRTVGPSFIGPLPFSWHRLPRGYVATDTDMVSWLAANIAAIAADEAAGELMADVDRLIRRIKNAINRPVPPRFCGPCTTVVYRKGDDGVIRKVTCGTLLDAPPRAIEVACPSCRTEHNVERLIETLALRCNHMRFTSAETLKIMEVIGEPLPERSWRRWRTEGRVKVRGYKRPDREDGSRGAIGLSRRSDDDEPVYRLRDVRKVWAKSVRHADTQVAETAHR